MNEPQWETCTEKDVWEYVGWHLAANGIDTVLVGGAVCAIYTDGAYQSGDLDFVARSQLEHKIPEVLASIGFRRKSGRHYIHPQCSKFIEFVVGPPGIGDDIKITPAEHIVNGVKLYIYSPTDCIRDRLASFIHFRARDCFEQAVLVARKYPFNKSKVKRWCKSEGSPEVYEQLLRAIEREG